MSLDVRFADAGGVFAARIEDKSNKIRMTFGNVVIANTPVPDGAYPIYAGAYIVTPKTDAQTLETAKKSMEKDVSIKAIPYFETSNTSGGCTVYIGTEVI